MDRIYTDDEILDEFGDVIDDLMVDQIYKTRRYAISVIRTILEEGIEMSNHDYILYVISQMDSIKNSQNIGRPDSLCRSSNKKIVSELMKFDDKKDVFDVSMDEDFKFSMRDINREYDRQNKL